MWQYDKALQTPDRANCIAWVLGRASTLVVAAAEKQLQNPDDRLWGTVIDLSPVALLER